MKDYIELTEYQKEWLNQHGGRDEKHVERDSSGRYYVWLGRADRGWEQVYLPQNN